MRAGDDRRNGLAWVNGCLAQLFRAVCCVPAEEGRIAAAGERAARPGPVSWHGRWSGLPLRTIASRVLLVKANPVERL